MTHTYKTFRGYSDLEAKRNALQVHAFSHLAKLCDQHGSRFQPIDLWWVVADEASLDQRAMNIYLGEIKRWRQIRPRINFIYLVGDRYDW